MNAFSNLELEQKLADMGVEVHRWMNMTNQVLHCDGQKNMHVKIRDLCQYEMGSTATANIWWARKCTEQRFDGLVHVTKTTTYPDVRTILEIGGQDSKIILVENGVAVDYAMNTLCAAGTGAFLSSQTKRLGIEVEEIGDYALRSIYPAQIAARCTVFAESDLVYKIQMGTPGRPAAAAAPTAARSSASTGTWS